MEEDLAADSDSGMMDSDEAWKLYIRVEHEATEHETNNAKFLAHDKQALIHNAMLTWQ